MEPLRRRCASLGTARGCDASVLSTKQPHNRLIGSRLFMSDPLADGTRPSPIRYRVGLKPAILLESALSVANSKTAFPCQIWRIQNDPYSVTERHRHPPVLASSHRIGSRGPPMPGLMMKNGK